MLLLALVTGVATSPGDAAAVLGGFVVLAAILPVLSAVLAGLRSVRGWVVAGPS